MKVVVQTKFRVECVDCGKRQPRATTWWGAEKWMREHQLTVHGTEQR